MLCQRLSAWFGTDHAGVVKDVLSGKERILPLTDVRRYPCQTHSACHFAALNFVRVAFKHMTAQRARRGSSPNMMRWLGALVERRGLEEMLSPCEQLTGERTIQLEDMRRIPLFEGTLGHAATKYGTPNMILFKQSLRQMQLQASPVSAIVVGRNTGTTVCLKLRENSKDVFLVLDLVLASLEHGHSGGTTLALVISTSLEQTAARLSGNLPLDHHLMTCDRRWQAQPLTTCTICMFTPVEVALSSEAESSAINENVALLKAMGDRGWELKIGGEREREAEGDRHRNQHQNGPPLGSSHGEPWGRTPFGGGGVATTSRIDKRASRVGGVSTGAVPSARTPRLRPRSTFSPYDQTKRHCRIFLDDDELSSFMNISPISSIAPPPDAPVEVCFECVICFENIPETAGIRLLPCAHGFCRDCLAGHVCSKIEERKFPVFCPLCMTEPENTSPSVVSGETVRRLRVSEAQSEIWAELEIAHFCVRVHCRRCDCTTFVAKEEYEQLEELSCPLPGCKHTWCKNCQQTISTDGPKHSCDGTEELDFLVRHMGWKYCPKCRIPVQKYGGCNHMTCATLGCNTHFCYRCGKQITRASIPFLVRSAVNSHFKQCAL